jgi:hypothetical protein
MSVGRQLLEELRRDEELRRALAEGLLPEALRYRELRRAVLVALSREIATKEDREPQEGYERGHRKPQKSSEGGYREPWEGDQSTGGACFLPGAESGED